MNSPGLAERERDYAGEDAGTEPAGADHRRAWLILAALLALYLLLVLFDLNDQGIKKDELTTSSSLRMAFTEMLKNRLVRGHAPLYFIIMWGWVRMVGQGPLTLMIPSILMGFGVVLLMIGLARELGLGRWAWAAGWLTAVHPSILYYARYARPNIGVLGFVIVLVWLMIRTLDRPESRIWLWLMIVGVISAAWNNLQFLTWLCAVAVVALSPGLRRRARRGFWLAAVVSLGAHIWMMWICARFGSATDPLGWIEKSSWIKTAQESVKVFGGMGISYRGDWWRLIFPAICLLAFGYIIGRCWGRQREQWLAWRIVLATALGPLLLMVIMTHTFKPMMVARYLVIAAPGTLLCVARLLSEITGRRWAIAVMLVCVGLLLGADRDMIRDRNTGLRPAIQQLEKLYDPDRDKVLVYVGQVDELFRLEWKRPYRLVYVPFELRRQEAWKRYGDQIGDCRRVWVVSFKYKKSWVTKPQWQEMLGRQFYHHRFNHYVLDGYDRP